MILYWGCWGWNYGLGRSPKGQGTGKTKLITNSEIFNFWATQTLYTSKESWEKSSFRFEIKLGDFVMKKLKKNWFCDFRSQKIQKFYRSQLNFWKTCQDSQKMTLLSFSWDLKNFCDHSLTLIKMTDHHCNPHPLGLRVWNRRIPWINIVFFAK